MGRVRTKTVKRASRQIIEKYYPRLTQDFHTNKRICDEIADIQSKIMRNKIAGFVTHLMKRIEKGPVRGISFKLQEEEREKRDNYTPEQSEIDGKDITIDLDTREMLRAMGVVPKGIKCKRIRRVQVKRPRSKFARKNVAKNAPRKPVAGKKPAGKNAPRRPNAGKKPAPKA